ncbi:MAG: energy transducer TonB [Gemmatimonadota bacterium]
MIPRAWWRKASLAPSIAIVLCSACSRPDGTMKLPANLPADRRDEPPIAVNAESPVEYPAAFFDQGIEGNVILRLYSDTDGHLVEDSTRVAESSGYPVLDSAAVRAAPKLKFAPALRNGTPVATAFLQPVQFRHPQRGGTSP